MSTKMSSFISLHLNRTLRLVPEIINYSCQEETNRSKHIVERHSEKMRKQLAFDARRCRRSLQQSCFFAPDWKAVGCTPWISSCIKNGGAAAKFRAHLELPVMLPTTKELKSRRNPRFSRITEAVSILVVDPYAVYTPSDTGEMKGG